MDGQPHGDTLEQLLAGINLNGAPPVVPDRTPVINVGGGKAGKEPKITIIEEPKIKKHVPVETMYEGFTIRPVSPAVGDKKSWAYCSSNPLPFDSAKLYSMATAHRIRIGKDAMGVYRELTVDQQALIDRITQMKNALDTNDSATWEPYDIRRVKKDVQKSFLRVERTLVALELILKRKDRTLGATSDKPTGTTTNPSKITGQLLDLSVPLDDYIRSLNPTKGKAAAKKNVIPPPPTTVKVPAAAKPAIPQNPDPALYFWNGEFYQEKSPERLAQERAHREARYQEQLNAQRLRHEAHLRQQAQQQQAQQQQEMARQQMQQEAQQRAQQEEAARRAQEQQEWNNRMQAEQAQNAAWRRQQEARQHAPPRAPMASDASNPFFPQGAHPGQFAPTIDHGEALDYDARARRRSRSRSRPRTLSRRRSRHRPEYSSSSDEESYYDESTPPSSPRGSVGSLHRQRKYRSSRYYEEQPRARYIEVERPRRRGEIEYDDYPGAQRRITSYAQGLVDAHYNRPRHRRRSVDDSRYEAIWRGGWR